MYIIVRKKGPHGRASFLAKHLVSESLALLPKVGEKVGLYRPSLSS
jgi:hypothetical protein